MSSDKTANTALEYLLGAAKQVRDVHVKLVPARVHAKARQNAFASQMSFREYVIHLLENSTPLLQNDPSPLKGHTTTTTTNP